MEAFSAAQIDLRMLVQQSAFTIHGTNEPINSLASNATFLIKYEIPAETKKDLLGELFVLGIKDSTLFPDLGHLADELQMVRDGQI